MNRIICLSLFIITTASAQRYSGDPRTAAILSEQRYQSGDGSFGSQYKQEDQTQFKEESLPDGTRKGTYSYVDPSGKTRTISYTAGKHGFMATGDGVPQAAPTVLPVAPQPQYNPLPQYNSPDYKAPQPQYEPEPQQYNPRPVQQYNTRPQQFNPAPQQFNQQPQQYNPQPQQYNPQPQQYNPQPQQYNQQPQQYEQSTTPAPHRFYPPGKLSLNRQPDGYSYNFQSTV